MSPERNIHRLAVLIAVIFAAFAATASAEPDQSIRPNEPAVAAAGTIENGLSPIPIPCDPDDGCFYDTDNDGVEDSVDNCKVTYNPDQADNDGDGIGNVCDDTPNGGGGGGGGGGSTVTASLSADPTTITRGQSTRLTWTSTNAPWCDSDWAGRLPFEGSQQLTPSVTTTYRVNCNGASASTTVTVNDAPPPPPIYACSDGADNDGDGKTDMTDPGCSSPTDNDEYDAPPAPAEPPPEYSTPGAETEIGSGPRSYLASEKRCFWAEWKDEKGSLFYNRKVTQRVEWCSRGGTIASYSVNDWPSTGLYCRPVWGPDSVRIAGGVGSSSVTFLTKGAFECNLRLLPDPTDWVEVDVRYHADGRREDV